MRAPSPLCVLCVLSLAWPALGQAQSVYKSVDAQGNVTYSSTPPPTAVGVEPVTIPSDASQGPSPEAQRSRQEVEQAAESQRMRQEQKERKAQRAAAITEAEKRLKDAQDSLEATKRQGDEERRSLERDAPVDTQAYRDRVVAEQRKVREAERALREAKAGGAPPDSEATPQPAAQAKR